MGKSAKHILKIKGTSSKPDSFRHSQEGMCERDLMETIYH